MITLTPQMSRLLAIALLVFALALPYVVIVRPLLATYRQQDEAIAEQRGLLDRYRRIAANRDILEARLTKLKEDPSFRTPYLSGDSEALVAAELQERVKAMIDRADGVLNSTQILPVESENGLRRVAIRVRMAGNIEALYETLYEIEASDPLLFVDVVDLTARATRRRRASAGAAADEDVTLNVTFNVYGYMRLG